MTPGEKNIVKALVALAWADGHLEGPESSVIEGLLCGFDASDEEEREILAYASEPRTLEADVPLDTMSRDDRELLLSNAALLTHADGAQSESERALLARLTGMLGFSEEEASAIIASACKGAR